MSIFTSSDVTGFQTDRLNLATASYFPNVAFSSTFLLQQLQAAEADIARQLKVYLEPTTVFPFDPVQADIDALAGAPWDTEPGYDYDPDFFRGDSWGFLVLRHKPVLSISFIRMSYPTPQSTFFTIPNEWIRLDKKYAQVRLVPASASFAAPLNAFMMQAMGGGSLIPSMIQVQYQSGLQNVKSDPRWADLMDCIYKRAAMLVLENGYMPQSGSISADGLSESISLDMDKHADIIRTKLFGPKGANGGLWVSIHGVVGSTLGALA